MRVGGALFWCWCVGVGSCLRRVGGWVEGWEGGGWRFGDGDGGGGELEL